MKTPAHLIKDYIESTGITKIEFCMRCHIHRSSLHKYLAGEPLHPIKARAIEYGTQGKIKADDLLRKN